MMTRTVEQLQCSAHKPPELQPRDNVSSGSKMARRPVTDPPLCSNRFVDLESYLEVERFEKKAQEEDQPSCLRREVICSQMTTISINQDEPVARHLFTPCLPPALQARSLFMQSIGIRDPQPPQALLVRRHDRRPSSISRRVCTLVCTKRRWRGETVVGHLFRCVLEAGAPRRIVGAIVV